MRSLVRSKIQKATVTHADIHYTGSITIDANLMDKADLWEGEKVLVVSVTSGARLETYVIPGERGSGIISMNGAAAHRIKRGEEIIILAFEVSAEPVEMVNILVDEKNQFARYL